MVVTQLAKNQNKIVVSSLHQPSSQMYHMFDGLLLLAKGKVKPIQLLPTTQHPISCADMYNDGLPSTGSLLWPCL